MASESSAVINEILSSSAYGIWGKGKMTLQDDQMITTRVGVVLGGGGAHNDLPVNTC